MWFNCPSPIVLSIMGVAGFNPSPQPLLNEDGTPLLNEDGSFIFDEA